MTVNKLASEEREKEYLKQKRRESKRMKREKKGGEMNRQGVVSLGCRTKCDPAAYLITPSLLTILSFSSSLLSSCHLVFSFSFPFLFCLLWICILQYSVLSQIYSSGGDIADPYPHHS